MRSNFYPNRFTGDSRVVNSIRLAATNHGVKSHKPARSLAAEETSIKKSSYLRGHSDRAKYEVIARAKHFNFRPQCFHTASLVANSSRLGATAHGVEIQKPKGTAAIGVMEIKRRLAFRPL